MPAKKAEHSVTSRQTDQRGLASLLKHRAPFCRRVTHHQQDREHYHALLGGLPDGGEGCFRAGSFVKDLWAVQSIISCRKYPRSLSGVGDLINFVGKKPIEDHPTASEGAGEPRAKSQQGWGCSEEHQFKTRNSLGVFVLLAHRVIINGWKNMKNDTKRGPIFAPSGYRRVQVPAVLLRKATNIPYRAELERSLIFVTF